jgi:NOL1/NOP2/sun family putative RNA methylase
MEKIEKLMSFQKKIKEIYGEKVGCSVLKDIEKKPLVSFRVNTLKADTKEVLRKLTDLGFKISNGEVPDSFYIDDSPSDLSLSRTRFFEEGEVYIQNISSMIPSLVLGPRPDENVLDLCAAPGSKTTHISALSENKAKIVAVENNINRLNSLKDNCKNQGVTNIDFIRASSQSLLRICPQFSGFFDKVLCDVPCSNEGLIRVPSSYNFKYWNPKLAKKLSSLQKKLIFSGINMLKTEGELVYSTCTYSVEENEQVINWALEKFPQMEVENINLGNLPTMSGIKTWKGKTFNENIKRTVRILPSNHYEAFFIAKLAKK